MKYEIFAAHYGSCWDYEELFETNSLLSALLKLRKFKKGGYEVINIRYRAPIRFDTSNWNHITSNLGEEDE